MVDVYCGLFILHRKTIMSQITFPARITEVNCSFPNRETIKQYEKHIQKYQEELDFFKKHIISE